jgi:aspartate aminotransferase
MSDGMQTRLWFSLSWRIFGTSTDRIHKCHVLFLLHPKLDSSVGFPLSSDQIFFCTSEMLRRAGLRLTSAFAGVQMGPPDPILGLSVAFNEDKAPLKVNLGVGVYRGDDNKPYVLECVRKAQPIVAGDNMEYAPITGVAGFVTQAQKLAFGNVSPLKEGRIASSQALSGTGALRLAGDFLNRFMGNKSILVPSPTWGNHNNVFRDSGLKVGNYRYYAKTTNSLDINGLLEDLSKASEGTIVLLHACAHNPTGIDPTREQWREIASVVKRQKLFPFVDMAYQGFASGDLENDAFATRLFAEECPSMALAQSFAKNLGLYGQRVGGVHFVTSSPEEKERVLSQLKILIRPIYSNPPLYGARIAETILTNPELTQLWHKELKGMSDRMNGVRRTLVSELKTIGSVRDWSHITSQIGMMAFTGLNKDQVTRLKSEFHVYMTDDGRAAISGLNSGNVKYVAKAFHEVSK